jgi:CHAT domain-containing protein/tetratricopeptide (TPR) repeat protein
MVRGSYRLETSVQATATAEDQKRLTAEALMVEATELTKQGSKTAEQVIGKAAQALIVWREVGDSLWIANALFMTGAAYSASGEPEKAIGFLEQALATSREFKLRAREGLTLSSLGDACYSLTRYEKAIEYYEQSLAIRREVKDRAGEGETLINLGVAYLTIRRLEKVIGYYEEALAIKRELKDRAAEGWAHHDLGIAYSLLSRSEEAIANLQQALAIFREVKDRRGEGYALDGLGRVHISLSRYEKTIEYYEQALVIYREVKRRPQEGSTLNSMGGVYRALGQYEKAVKCSEQALAISREVKNPEYEIGALSSLARTERERGNLVEARSYIEESLKVAERLRANEITSPVSRATLLASVQSSYQLYTDILMRQHRAEPTKGLDALAVEVSERQRARSLLDQLGEARLDVREGVDPALIERERAAAKKLSEKAQTRAATADEAAALKREISELETELERTQVAIRKANPHYAGLAQPQPLKLSEIQQKLDPDTVLLEYALGEERSYLWAISKDSLKGYELAKGKEIDKNARQLHELLSARSTTKRGESALQRQQRITEAEVNLPAAAQALSQMVLAPVAGELGNKRLVIVADGALQYIPFAMLPEPVAEKGRRGEQESGRKGEGEKGRADQVHPFTPSPLLPVTPTPLIVNHEVVSLPSASVLALQRDELKGRQAAPKLLAVIADPVFEPTDVRLKMSLIRAGDHSSAPTPTADDTRRIEHLAVISGDKSAATRRLAIPRLPFTRQEATRLQALAPKKSSFVAMDFQASRETVIKGGLDQYRYIHFATHGLLDSERPGLSSLVLSMLDAEGKAQDGFLRANDIYNLKLPAELVVLSACQTGLGQEIRGEGLMGLTRGFMYAGAARVVVSLWNVNDRATSELMAKFYEKMLKENQRPAAALRAAQVEMWKQKQWQSPFYWAAFTMQGEWR